jgi:hypothetical protein
MCEDAEKGERTLLVTSQVVRRELDVSNRKFLRCWKRKEDCVSTAVVYDYLSLRTVRYSKRRTEGKDEATKSGKRRTRMQSRLKSGETVVFQHVQEGL